MLYVIYLRAYTTMPDYDDSLGGQTMGGEDNEDRFEKSLGDEATRPRFRRVPWHVLRSIRRHD